MTIKREDFMLCQSITEEEAILLSDTEYTAQLKYDGCRVIAVVMDNQSVLINRDGRICNFNFEEVVEDVRKLPNGIYDGEVISLCDTFNKLQKRALTKDRKKMEALRKEVPVKYMVFDILNINKAYITSKPLKERIEIMREAFKDKQMTNVELAEYKPIKEMLEKAHKEDREGIVIKAINMPYEHRRSKNWLKCKFFEETTIKVCKYETNPRGITAEDEWGNRVQIAGFQSQEVKQLLDTQKEVEIHIQFLEKTLEGRFRFISFRGLVK